MRLGVFVVNPLRVSPHRLGKALGKALDSMAPRPRGHSCASPERGTDQMGILGAESDSTVFHEPYDPIVAEIYQRAIFSGFGFPWLG